MVSACVGLGWVVHPGTPPSPSASQWDPPWEHAFLRHAAAEIRVPVSTCLFPICQLTEWARHNGYPCVRNDLFLLFCYSYSYHIIHWLTSPAAWTCVPPAGKNRSVQYHFMYGEVAACKRIKLKLFSGHKSVHSLALSSLQLKDLLRWYAEEFKDPMVLDPPEWFKSFIFCEALLQTPFFPVAAYAFLKGQLTVTVVWYIIPVASHHAWLCFTIRLFNAAWFKQVIVSQMCSPPYMVFY